MAYIVILLLLLIAAVPIGMALLSVGLGYLFVTERVDPLIAAQRVATGIDNFALMAIPFFLLAAELMNRTGITDRIFRLANCLMGGVPGGLGHVNVVASMIFASMSGLARRLNQSNSPIVALRRSCRAPAGILAVPGGPLYKRPPFARFRLRLSLFRSCPA